MSTAREVATRVPPFRRETVAVTAMVQRRKPGAHLAACPVARDVLKTVPGTRWEEERGLNDRHYIVPGGGGFGEILNNAFV